MRAELAACRLADNFRQTMGHPVRLREWSTSSLKRTGKDKRFRADVELWRQLIETMLAKVDPEQAWRFLDLSPATDSTIGKLTDCRDFCDLIDYLVLRRDAEGCGSGELGCLTWLSVAFQREVEKQIKSREDGHDTGLPI